MNDEIAETLGLSSVGARLIRALFQYNDTVLQYNDTVGYSRAERRRWLCRQVPATDAIAVLPGLERAGLVTSEYRLTWLGLTLAVNLPPLSSLAVDPLAA